MPARQSGLQRDVLKLCRDLFRAARKKDPGNEHKFTDFGKQLCEESLVSMQMKLIALFCIAISTSYGFVYE